MDALLGVSIFPPPGENLARTVSYPDYLHEILSHAGLCYASVPLPDLPAKLSALRILITVGDLLTAGDLTPDLQQAIRAWVREGGAWISVGGVCGMPDLFGVEVEAPAFSSWGGGPGVLGEGYLEAGEPDHPVTRGVGHPLHFFNGIPVEKTEGTVLAWVLDVHWFSPDRAAVVEHHVGKGCCLLIAPDLTGAVVRVQQGIAVTRDGVPASDGTAPLCDGVLKSGDGGVLDWIFDRQPVPGAPGFTAFLEPVADRWRDLLLRSIFYLARTQDMTLPLLWMYPRNLPALAHLSHDTDGNEPGKARRLLEVLEEAGAPGSWCTILPGYPPELMEAIAAAGHELAMHYDAMTPGLPWSEAQFHRQWQELVDLFGGQKPVTNKNHYLRWEGDTELLHWCAGHGIGLDQSRGASKTGEAGYNFGTCHLHFPVDPNGAVIDVLEMATPTQDLLVFAPAVLFDALLETVERHHGVIHLLFHPAHIQKPGVAEALLEAVARAKERGLEWWTARQLNEWERQRRRTRWIDWQQDTGGGRVCLETPAAIAGEGPTLLLLDANRGWIPGRSVRVNGAPAVTEAVERWGVRFQAVSLPAPGAASTGEPGNDPCIYEVEWSHD